jgi:hypothetical protein
MTVLHIGKYTTSDGELYNIWYWEYKGKKYLYAVGENYWSYYSRDRQYSLYYGEIVAKDYFKTKSQFLQKKLLYEKKLKSDSQRHVDSLPRRDPKYTGNTYIKNNPKWPYIPR